jgi:catechol 2,3-dioxygenase-like lactoylglutathione lyase family enzyme
MFSYVCLGANDTAHAARFYDATLGVLGIARCYTPDPSDRTGRFGWGSYTDAAAPNELSLWVGPPFDAQSATAGNGTMVALHATSRQQVDKFHATALTHGGSSEGTPGLRPQYGANFYAAYVRDPDGNKLAVVCRDLVKTPSLNTPSLSAHLLAIPGIIATDRDPSPLRSIDL